MSLLGGVGFLFITLQLPISYFLIDKLYVLPFFILIASFVTSVSYVKINKFVFTYFVLLLFTFIASFMLVSTKIVFIGFISYAFMQFFSFLYFSSDRILRIKIIYRANILVVLIVSFGAFYQMFVDPLLFGMYSNTSFESFDKFASQRTASFLGSTQAYASYMLFSIIFFDYYKKEEQGNYYLLHIVVFLSGTLSGSVGFFVGYFIYFFLKKLISLPSSYSENIIKSQVYLFSLLFFCIFLYFNLDSVLNLFPHNSSFYRVLSYFIGTDSLGLDSGDSVRVSRWLSALDNGSLYFMGNGIGSAGMLSSDIERLNFESYLFTLYYEGGLLLTLSFLGLIFGMIYSNGKIIIKNIPVFSVVLFYSLIVHTFFLVTQTIVWILIFSIVLEGSNEKKSCN